ncbi:MAG: molybdopterin-dependent oxidoreductase [Emcibacteraceae bacterium]|nr:molybdopterin-dependent oxidoreductase [Emcibacteraceae bacterium]MDG1726928.1 molybdopterin-dependent oxidoreductase [Emcibacteraceae bacterium]
MKIAGTLKKQDTDDQENSTCYMCSHNCEIHVSTREAEGSNEKTVTEIALPDCVRGSAMVEHRESDVRLLNPEMRNENGEWVKSTWQQTIDAIADNLKKVRDKYGPESVGFMIGYTKEPRPYMQRLAYLFGSPHYFTESSCCFGATRVASALTFGDDYGYFYQTSRVFQPETQCRMVWSNDTENSQLPLKKHYFFKETDVPLIVVDPRLTSLAKTADVHLRLRPGTDGALALGLAHIILNEGWEDREFLNNWCHGVSDYEEMVKEYTPERTAKITGVDKELIIKAACLYGQNKPAQISLSPQATVHHSNACQNHRAIILLAALTGNIDVKGGHRKPGGAKEADITLHGELLPKLADPIGKERFPIFIDKYHEGQSMLLSDYIEKGKIKAIVSIGANIMMYPDYGRLQKQMEKLEFFSVCDFYDTPTRAYADVSLPAATHLERESLIVGGDKVRYRPNVIEPRGNAKADADILFELANALGLKDDFWGGDIKASFNERLEGTGYTLSDLPEKGKYAPFDLGPDIDRKYEKDGFATNTGKVEFKSTILEEHGHNGLPEYQEPYWSPVSRPDLTKDYPFILTTGGRSKNYQHSQGRKLEMLRAIEPYPVMQINPIDAAKLDIKDDDWLKVSSPRGEIELRALVSEIVMQGVVHAPHGWEAAPVNKLIPDEALCPITGFPGFKSSLCSLEKITK